MLRIVIEAAVSEAHTQFFQGADIVGLRVEWRLDGKVDVGAARSEDAQSAFHVGIGEGLLVQRSARMGGVYIGCQVFRAAMYIDMYRVDDILVAGVAFELFLYLAQEGVLLQYG